MTEADFNKLYSKIKIVQKRQSKEAFRIVDNCLGAFSVVYIFAGKGYFSCNGNKRLLSANTLVYYPPSSVVDIHPTKDLSLKYYIINFNAALLDIGFDSNLVKFNHTVTTPQFNFPFFKKIDSPPIQKELLEKFDKLHRIYISNNSSRKKIFYESQYLNDFLKYIHAICNSYTPNKSKEVVDICIGYIHTHFNEDITLKLLSELCGISPSYLTRLFKSYIGLSPIDYLINTRISNSKELIENGISFSEVAVKCGFSDVYHFSNTFKKREGVAPSTYKKSLDNGIN